MTPSPASPDWGVRVLEVGPSSPTPLQAKAFALARWFFGPVQQEPQGAPAAPVEEYQGKHRDDTLNGRIYAQYLEDADAVHGSPYYGAHMPTALTEGQ